MAGSIAFSRKERIDDSALRDAVQRAECGLVDADLGGGVIKQRVARPGKGKSGGYRTLILFRHGDRAIFAFGFAKSAQANISKADLRSEEHTSELQSLMRISYAVFCLKKT